MKRRECSCSPVPVASSPSAARAPSEASRSAPAAGWEPLHRGSGRSGRSRWSHQRDDHALERESDGSASSSHWSVSSPATAGPSAEVGNADHPPEPFVRAMTSSERGKIFRRRQKQYEKDLVVHVLQLRAQVVQLQSARDLVRSERALSLRTSHSGSLVRLVRELYTVLRFGLEPPVDKGRVTDSQLLVVEYKENFMLQVLEPDVQIGDLVGVDAVMDQMRRHTASYAAFEIEMGDTQVISSVEWSPVVAISLKLHVRYSRESFPVMFPGALECRPALAAKFLGRDLTLDCVTRFHFADSGKIKAYLLEINFVEALVKAVGSARDVAELMQFSIVTKEAIMEETRIPRTDDEDRRIEYSWRRHSRDGNEDGSVQAVEDVCDDRVLPPIHELRSRGLSYEERLALSAERGRSSDEESAFDHHHHPLSHPAKAPSDTDEDAPVVSFVSRNANRSDRV